MDKEVLTKEEGEKVIKELQEFLDSKNVSLFVIPYIDEERKISARIEIRKGILSPFKKDDNNGGEKAPKIDEKTA